MMQKEIHDEDMMSLVVAMGVNYDSDILKIKNQFFVLYKSES